MTQFFLLAVLPAIAGAPGDRALAFLEEVRDGERPVAELLEESALSPYCGSPRRIEISQRLGRLGRHLRSEEQRFEVLEEKVDGNLASALLAATSDHDPMNVDVWAVGLRKGASGWLVAPVPGSFDNVNLDQDESLEQRADALEVWMSTNRLRHLRKLHQEVAQKFRERMEKAIPPRLLEQAKPTEVVEAFVQACLERNIPGAMALLGGLDGRFTEEDQKVHQIVRRGIRGLDQRNRWRLLTSRDVVRIVVQEDPGDDLDAEVVLLIFDPAARKPVELLRFVLLRSGKRWEIELPDSLLMADENRLQFQRALWDERDGELDELKERFERYFEKRHEPRRFPDLEEAGKTFERILGKGTLEEFLTCLYRDDEFRGADRKEAYEDLGKFWRNLHKDGGSASEAHLAGVVREDDAAILVFHFVSTVDLAEVTLVPLALVRTDGGWAVAPGVRRAANFDALSEKQQANQTGVFKKYEKQAAVFANEAEEKFLARFAAASPALGVVISEGEAGEVVNSFRDHLREGHLSGVFEHCALLDHEEGVKQTLEGLTYQYRGARFAKVPDRLLEVQAGSGWAAVTLRIGSGPNNDVEYPMYLLVATDQGPRIVVDVDLRLARNKGRELLNERDWEILEAHLDDAETALVRKFFQGHVTRSKADLEKWEKSIKSSP